MNNYIYIVGSIIAYVILFLMMFLAKRSTKIMRLSVLCIGFLLLFYSVRKPGFLQNILGLPNLLIIVIDFLLLMSYLLLSIVTLKFDINYGNYFILSYSLLKNIIDNKSEKKSRTEVGLGNIVPFNKSDINKCGLYMKLNSRVLSSGMLISGSSGSGKTYTIKEMIKQDFDNGSPILYFDFKGDIKLRKELIDEATKHHYDIFCFNENYPYFFDPLASLSTEGRVEAIMSTRKWSMDGSDSHFRTNAKLLIQRYVSQFDKYLQTHLDDYGVMTESELAYTKHLYHFMDKNKPDLSNRDISDAYKTFKTLLEIVLTSGMKATMMNENLPHFSFEDFELEGNSKYIVLVSLPSENKELGNSITNLYLQNLISVGVKVQSFSKDVKLYLEEFGTLQDSMVVKDLLEKGRSMNINTCISLQDIYQVVINTNEAYLNSLLGTITNYLIFAGTTKKAAELISGVQIKDIDKILLSLKRPNIDYGDRPTALFITKNALLDRGKSSEVYKIFPGNKMRISELFGESFDDGDSSNNDSKPSKREVRKAKDKLFVDMMHFKEL